MRFLSNFWECRFYYDNRWWSSSEAAYQAAKTLCEDTRDRMTLVSPGASKRLGQALTLRPDWEEVKNDIMFDIVLAKFLQNPQLAVKLIATDGRHLEEGNTWNDRYWGVCPPGSGKGQNQLGIILMRVRDILMNRPSGLITC